MKNKLQTILKPSRYQHSLGVCDVAVKMAKSYGVDTEKAYIAGLLHDCAKGYDNGEQMRLCSEYGVMLDHITLECPAIIHAPLGAEVAKREFGITDTEILNAIKKHTVAGSCMTDLEKIIYTADMIEPMRDFDGVAQLRNIAYTNLNTVFIESLKQSISFNLIKQKIIHPDTLSAWNDVLISQRLRKE